MQFIVETGRPGIPLPLRLHEEQFAELRLVQDQVAVIGWVAVFPAAFEALPYVVFVRSTDFPSETARSTTVENERSVQPAPIHVP